jgi:putative ABC transport system substrate-binding protein
LVSCPRGNRAAPRRRDFIGLVGGVAGAWPAFVFAPKPAHIVSIGFLSVNTPAAVKARADAFQDGLRELGYIDGQNAFVAYRFA